MWVDFVVVAGFVNDPKDGAHDDQGDSNTHPNLKCEQ